MNPDSSASLETVLRDCNLGWMIDWYNPREKAISFWLDTLANVTTEFHRRFGDSAPDLNEVTLSKEVARNPLKVAAFLQALSGRGSPQMLVMVWRITIQGLEVESVQMDYHYRTRFSLRVQLRSPSPTASEVYESDDISDAKLLRHFGTFKSGGQPVFVGFYPLTLETK